MERLNIFFLYLLSFEGETYYLGQKMYSEENPCLVCHCSGNWTDGGPADRDANCYEIDCYSRRSQDQLLRGCRPVHQEGTCCPVDWICPEDEPEDVPVIDDTLAPRMGPECPEGGSLNVGPATFPLMPVRAPTNNVSDVCLLPRNNGPCTPGFEDKW